MERILFYVINLIIIFAYIWYFLLIIINRRRKISDSNGFDVIKDIISEYNSINIIEGNSKFSFYNIKRRVIKLSKDDYYGSNVSSISLSLIQAGISIVDDMKNIFINWCRKIIPTLRIFDLLGIIILVINYVSVTVSDARIGIILGGIIIFIYYMYVDVLNNSYNFIYDNVNKIDEIRKDSSMILEFVNKVLLINKIIFIGEIVFIIRMVSIILGM